MCALIANVFQKPVMLLKPGDVLTLTLYSGVRVIRILGTAHRRGPASEAVLLYEDVAENPTDSKSGCISPEGLLLGCTTCKLMDCHDLYRHRKLH